MPTSSPGVAPAITVVVPLYNCAPYIQECLGSLQAQTLDDFEVWCIDDGSTDGSLELARAQCSGDGRFRFGALPANRGQSAARNAALRQARGEYVVLLDADDYLLPDALEEILGRLRAQNLDDLYFSARSFYESQDVHGLVREDFSQRPAFEGVATGKELFTFFEEHGQFFPQAALRACRRSLIEDNDISFFEGIIHEDVLFTFRTLVVSQRSSFLNKALYMRRVRPGSTMTSPKRTIRNVHGHFVCAQEMGRWMKAHAGELEGPFIKAMTHRVAEYMRLAARDWHADVDGTERTRYLEGLSPADRLDFYTSVIWPGAALEQLQKEFYASRTYRLGNALVGLPRLLRNKIASALRYRRER